MRTVGGFSGVVAEDISSVIPGVINWIILVLVVVLRLL
jgi:hypothetical protein